MNKFIKILIFFNLILILVSCRPPGQPKPRMDRSDAPQESLNSTSLVSRSGTFWSIESNGIPLHELNSRAYTNRYKEQSYKMRIPVNPERSSKPVQLAEQFPKAFGVTLDGVKLDPLTAECYDDSGNKSNPRNCGYRLDALQTIRDLRFDEFFGHVQPASGAYHYHAYSRKAAELVYTQFNGAAPGSDKDLVLVGFARDGYPVFFSLKNSFRSSYAVDSAKARTGMDGSNKANGIYVQDYKYTASDSSRSLDECNGISTAQANIDIASLDYPGVVELDSKIDYFYVVNERFQEDGKTPHFPAIGHCYKGLISSRDGF